MYGLLEVDVTVVRQFIAEHKTRTGETLSFTGFLTYLSWPKTISDLQPMSCCPILW